MSSLEFIQNKMLHHVFNPKDEGLDFLKNTDISAQERFNVCRNTVISGLISSLKVIYPGVWRLIGKDCADGVARAYIQDKQNLVSSGEMNNFGSYFPAFLQNFESTKKLSYLSDYAKLEFYRFQSYYADNRLVVNPQDIAQALESDIENLRIQFNDSVYLLETEWPVDLLQNLLDNPNSQDVAINPQKRNILIYKSNDQINCLYLQSRKWQIIANLRMGETMGNAILSGMDENEITGILSFLLGNKLISRFIC